MAATSQGLAPEARTATWGVPRARACKHLLLQSCSVRGRTAWCPRGRCGELGGRACSGQDRRACHLEEKGQPGPRDGRLGLWSPALHRSWRPSGRRLCRCPPWAPRGRRPSCRLGPVQATPPAPPCYWPRPLLPPAPHTAFRGAGLPRPGAQPPKPSRKRTEGIGALSFPLPGPCDLISWSICSRASCLLMPACYLASAEKPPSRLASVLAPVGARDSVPGAKCWGSWGPADPSLVWRSC